MIFITAALMAAERCADTQDFAIKLRAQDATTTMRFRRIHDAQRQTLVRQWGRGAHISMPRRASIRAMQARHFRRQSRRDARADAAAPRPPLYEEFTISKYLHAALRASALPVVARFLPLEPVIGSDTPVDDYATTMKVTPPMKRARPR